MTGHRVGDVDLGRPWPRWSLPGCGGSWSPRSPCMCSSSPFRRYAW